MPRRFATLDVQALASYLKDMTTADTSQDPSASPASGNIADLAIVGAGPTGATLAIAAAQAGFSVCLIDARDPDIERPDGRNFAIVRGSW